MPDTAPDASAPAAGPSAVPSAVPSAGSAGSAGSALEDGATEGNGSRGRTSAEGAPDTAPEGAREPDTALEPIGGGAPSWAPHRYSARVPPVPPSLSMHESPVATSAAARAAAAPETLQLQLLPLLGMEGEALGSGVD